MKKKVFLVLLVIVVLIGVLTSYIFIKAMIGKYEENHPDYYIKKKTHISVNNCKTKYRKERRAGNGDGTLSIILNCNKNSINFKTNHWKKLPLSENLNIFMYGNVEKNGTFYAYDTAKENNIPKIENGYYYFANKNVSILNKKDKYNDHSLFNHYSHNFVLVIYDTENDILYYLEYDS